MRRPVTIALLMLVSLPAWGAPTEGGPTGPGGAEVMCDLPVGLRQKNVGGRDGAGCCTFASVQHSARFQNERRLWTFLNDVAAHERGGGWPAKMDAMIAKYGDGTRYLQYEGSDSALLEAALKSGRMPAVTYDGHDPHYGLNRTIAHMVNLVYLDDKYAAILDNNFTADLSLMWMTRQEFLQRWTGGGSGWAVVLVSPAPAPVPKP